MKYIKKGHPPQALIEYQKTANASYGGMHGDVKEEIRKALVEEQKGICAYCMKRVSPNREKCTIEHYEPQKGVYAKPERQLDYQNMLGVCTDDEGKAGCSTMKKDAALQALNPQMRSCEKLLRFNKEGVAYGTQERAKADIETLELNHSILIDRRQAVIDEARKRLMKKAGSHKNWTSTRLEKEIQWWSSVHKTRKSSGLQPFCQAAICYLESKLAAKP
mgnify:CR=1 FL=1